MPDMIKRRISFSLALCLTIALGAAYPQEKGADIRKLLTEQVAAWNAGDIDGYMKGYWNSDSTMFVSGGNVTTGYRDVLARYHKSYDSREKMGKLEFSDLLIRTPSPDLAIATGVWRLVRKSDQPWGRFTLLIAKKPEGWRIVYDHTSSAN